MLYIYWSRSIFEIEIQKCLCIAAINAAHNFMSITAHVNISCAVILARTNARVINALCKQKEFTQKIGLSRIGIVVAVMTVFCELTPILK